MSAKPFGLFRIAFGLILAAEYGHLLYFRRFLIAGRTNPWLPGFSLAIWSAGLVLALGLAAGILTRLAAVGSYLSAVGSFGLLVPRLGCEYHADCYLIAGALVCTVCPVNRAFSIDRWRSRETDHAPGNDTVSAANTVLVAIMMSAVYLDAFTWKIASASWRAGLGVWVPLTQPFATYIDMSWLSDSELVVRVMGYVVLLFQIGFPLLVWIERLRPILVAVGVGMHLGIGLSFPIPLFGLVAAAFYLPLLSPWIYRLMRIEVADSQIDSPPLRTGEGVAPIALGVLWIALWPVVNSTSALHRKLWFAPPSSTVGRLEVKAQRLARRVIEVIYPLTGMMSHGIFLQSHFENHEAEYRVEFRDASGLHPIPLTTNTGTMSWYGLNRNWCIYSWYRYSTDSEKMFPVLVRFADFWAENVDADLSTGEVRVFRREATVSLTDWRQGVAIENRSRPWRQVAMPLTRGLYLQNRETGQPYR